MKCKESLVNIYINVHINTTDFRSKRFKFMIQKVFETKNIFIQLDVTGFLKIKIVLALQFTL